MFGRILQNILFVFVVSLSGWAQAQPDNATAQQPSKISIVIEGQLIRFVTQQEAQEWRLEVVNRQGAVVFDSGWVYGVALEWPLKDQGEQALPSGLYAYSLSSKTAAQDTLHHQRGHLILDRASYNDRIWLTSSPAVAIGAGSDAGQVTVVGSRETTLGGTEIPGVATRPETTTKRSELPLRALAKDGAAKAARSQNENISGTGTTNRLTKWSDGPNGELGDSSTTEIFTGGGFVTTFGAAPTIAAPYHVVEMIASGSKTPLTLVGGSGSMEFWKDGAASKAVAFGMARPGLVSSDDTVFSAFNGSAWFERMRLTNSGYLGIRTTAPQEKLHVSGGTAIFDRPNGAIRVTKTLGVLSDDDLGIWNRSAADSQPFAIADWQTGTKGIFLNTSTGNTGIGTGAPQATLDVRGDIRLGPSGQYRATSGEENLRIVRGIVYSNAATIAGRGFFAEQNPQDSRQFTVYFTTPFASAPTFTATLDWQGGAGTASEILIDQVTSSSVRLVMRTRHDCSQCDPARAAFNFIAIGPR